MLSVVEALALLTPYDVDRRKERIGPATDGGYVLLPDLFGRLPLFSYGISTEYRFDIDMSERGHEVFMFDHTIDGLEVPPGNLRMHWFKEGVGGMRDPSQPVDTIENHLSAHVAPGSDALLKMDVEGWEYDAFDALSDASLLRFQQIVFEIHNLHALGDPGFRARFVRLLSRLTAHYTLFHVHANNWDGSNAFTFISGVPVSSLLELSFVRSDLVERRPSRTLYPSPLDYPCVHPHDKKLWFFPFLPTGVTPAEFHAAEQRLDMAAQLIQMSTGG